MKTKILSMKWIMMLIFSVFAITAVAQPSTVDPDRVCLNSTESYWVINTPGSSYSWVLSGGGTILTGQGTDQITIQWNSTGPYVLEVTETFASTTGCVGDPVILNIIVDPLPAPIISGSSQVCVNSIGNVYTTESGMSNYVWNVSAGGLITAGGGIADASVTVTWNTVGPQTVSVNYDNLDGCTAGSATIFDVTVNPLPVTSPIWHN